MLPLRGSSLGRHADGVTSKRKPRNEKFGAGNVESKLERVAKVVREEMRSIPIKFWGGLASRLGALNNVNRDEVVDCRKGSLQKVSMDSFP